MVGELSIVRFPGRGTIKSYFIPSNLRYALNLKVEDDQLHVIWWKATTIYDRFNEWSNRDKN